ncbi:hypothetical protein MHB81_04625 [Paenibacillus sp. FSL H7-0326]
MTTKRMNHPSVHSDGFSNESQEAMHKYKQMVKSRLILVNYL